MKNRPLLLTLCLASLITTLLPAHKTQACSHQGAVVSTSWLAGHLNRPDLVIVDIRSNAEFIAGHISGAVNLPFAVPLSAWSAQRNGLTLEVPSQDELSATLGAAGIDRRTFVVVVNKMQSSSVPTTHLGAMASRVAVTLIYAGVKDVAILDGGITKWSAEARPLTTEIRTPTPVNFDGRAQGDIFVSKQYVEASLGNPRIVLADARDANVYSGEVPDSAATRLGHIPGAFSLPAGSIWNADGTYKSREELWNLAVAVIGERRSKETILYCSVGGLASGWWFILTEVLGYRNIEFYDGSAQEWSADPNAPLVTQ